MSSTVRSASPSSEKACIAPPGARLACAARYVASSGGSAAMAATTAAGTWDVGVAWASPGVAREYTGSAGCASSSVRAWCAADSRACRRRSDRCAEGGGQDAAAQDQSKAGDGQRGGSGQKPCDQAYAAADGRPCGSVLGRRRRDTLFSDSRDIERRVHDTGRGGSRGQRGGRQSPRLGRIGHFRLALPDRAIIGQTGEPGPDAARFVFLGGSAGGDADAGVGDAVVLERANGALGISDTLKECINRLHCHKGKFSCALGTDYPLGRGAETMTDALPLRRPRHELGEECGEH